MELCGDKQIATVEVLEKVLSEPIRPDFVIANIGGVLNLKQTTQLVRNFLLLGSSLK